MLWLPTTEVQAASWTEAWISSQRTQNMQIWTMKAHTASDHTVALGRPEAVGHPEDPVYSNQDNLTALMTDINDLYQQVVAGVGEPAETLDCIGNELQYLSIACHQHLLNLLEK